MMNVDKHQAPQTQRERRDYEPLITRSDKKHVSIPVNDQELAQKFESFQEFVSRDGNLISLISREDFEKLEQIYKTLNREALVENSHRLDIVRTTKELERIKNSELPVVVKVKMTESLVESIRTNINCIQEKKKTTKEMIIALEKANNYSTYLNLIRKWKESNKISRSHSISTASATIPTNRNSIAISPVDHRNSMIESTPKSADSFPSNQARIENSPQEDSNKALDDVKQDNAQLEDVIASLKQTKNILCVAVESCRDDLEDYQIFVHAHKNRLRSKIEQIEGLKVKISEQSSRNSANPKLWHTYNQPANNETLNLERSTSVPNTTVLQDVQSKVSSLFGKVFSTKPKDSVSGQVLPTDFLEELDLQERQLSSRDDLHKSVTASKNDLSSSTTTAATGRTKFSIKMPKLNGRLIMQRLTKS